MVVNQLLKYGEFGIVLFDNFQVTERTRNRVTSKIVRGFESHRLRQTRLSPHLKPQGNPCGFYFYNPNRNVILECNMKPNTNNKKLATQKKKPQAKKQSTSQMQSKKQNKKLTRVQYDDLRQIEWVPFDPYAD